MSMEQGSHYPVLTQIRMCKDAKEIVIDRFSLYKYEIFSDISFKIKKVLRKCAETKRKLMSSENVVLTSSVVNDYSIEIAFKRGKLPQEAFNSFLLEFNNFLCIGSISEKDGLIRIT